MYRILSLVVMVMCITRIAVAQEADIIQIKQSSNWATLYKYNNEYLKSKALDKLLFSKPTSALYVKRARANKIAGTVVSIVGTSLLVSTLYVAKKDGLLYVFPFFSGVLLTGAIIPLRAGNKKNLHHAITKFNE